MNETREIFGFPVVVTDAAPEGEIVFGRFPTQEELDKEARIRDHPYDICDWIEDHPTQFTVVKGLGDE